MRIRYSNSLADLIAFNNFHLRRSQLFRRERRKAFIVFPFLILVSVLGGAAVFESVRVLVYGGMFLGLYLLLIWRGYTTGMNKKLRDYHTEKPDVAFICEHTLEVAEEGLNETTAVSSRADRWEGIQEVITHADRTFVYIGPCLAQMLFRKMPFSRAITMGFVAALS